MKAERKTRPQSRAKTAAPAKPKKQRAKIQAGESNRRAAESKRGKKILRDPELNYQSIFEQSPLGIFQSTPQGRYKRVNPAMARIFGYDSPEEMTANITNIADQIYVSPATRREFQRALAESGEIHDVLNENYRRDGARIWTQTTARAVKDHDGVILYYEGFVADVTAHKRAEEALRESEEHLRLSTELANVAVWEYSFITNSMSRSKNHDRLYGLEWQTSWDINTFLNATHPDDRNLSNETIQKSVAAGGPDQYQFDFRAVHPDQSIHWLTVIGQVVERNSEGQGALVRGCLIDITERKRAQEALQENASRLLQAQHTARMGFLDWNLKTNIIFLSDEIHSIYGLDPQQIFTTPELVAKVVHPDDVEYVQKNLEMAVRGVKTYDIDHRILRPDGKILWVHSQAELVRDASGNPVSLLGTSIDITERRQAEEKIARLNRLYATLSQINQVIVRAGEPDALLEEICRVAVEYGKFRMAWIGLIDETEGLVKPIHFAGEEQGYLSNVRIEYLDEELGRGPVGAAIREARCVVCQDIASDPRMAPWREPALQRGYHSLAVVPFRRHNALIGMLAVYAAETQNFDSDDERLLDEIGSDISFALDTMDAEAQRRQAELSLSESEARYLQLLEVAPVGIAVHQEGKIVFANPAGAKLLGANAPADLIGKPIREIVHPDGWEAAKDRIQRMLNGEQGLYPVEDQFIKFDGSTIHVEAVAAPLIYNKKPAVQVIVSDITERKKARDEIRRLQEFDENLINHMAEGIAVQNADGYFIYANPAALSIIGYASEEFIGRHWTEFFPADQRPIIEDNDRRRMAGEASRYEIDFLHKNGKRINLTISGSPLFENGRFNGSMAVFADITQRRQAEERLRDSEERYRLLFRRSPVGVFHFDAALHITDCNERFVSILQSSRERLIGLDMNLLHDQSIMPALRQTLGGQDGFYEGLYRATTSHAVIWVSMRTASLFNEQGQIIGGVGIVEDITERRRAQQQIADQLQRMEALHIVDRAIAANFDLRITLETLLEQLTSHANVDAASICLFDKYALTLEHLASVGFTNAGPSRGASSRIEESLAGRVVIERRAIRLSNLSEPEIDPVSASRYRSEKFVAYYAVPLISRGRVNGVIETFQRSPRDAAPDWLNFIDNMAEQAAIAIDNSRLFSDLQRSNMELALAYNATIEGWSRALDLRDRDTSGHTLRVTEIAMRLANQLGLDQEQQVKLRQGALLHDIGKLGVPDSILLKPGALNDEEWEIMRRHPLFAYEMLQSVEYLRPSLDVPYCHHEKWDGTGYPRGLKGEQIPLNARIFAVADVWDALRSDRPYRAAWPEAQTVEYIREQAGKHFDPQIVNVFLSMIAGQ